MARQNLTLRIGRMMPGEHPVRIGTSLYHGATRERRKLRDCSFLAPFKSIAKNFANHTIPGRFGTAIPIPTRSGWLNRYIVQREPRLLDLGGHPEAIRDLMHWLAHHGHLKLRTMPPTYPHRRGAWLTEIAPAVARSSLMKGIDGWALVEGFYVEIMLVKPMQFLRFWSSTEVTLQEQVRRGRWPKDVLEGLGGMAAAPDDEAAPPSDDLLDRFISIDD